MDEAAQRKWVEVLNRYLWLMDLANQRARAPGVKAGRKMHYVKLVFRLNDRRAREMERIPGWGKT